jgi:hypothetical protein
MLQKLLITPFSAFLWSKRLAIKGMSFYGAFKPKDYRKLSQWHV